MIIIWISRAQTPLVICSQQALIIINMHKLHVFSLCLKSIMKPFLILVVSLLLIGFVNGDPLECPEEGFELAGNTIGTASNVTLWKACGETLNHLSALNTAIPF